MPLKIIFREFNDDEEGLRFYVSDTPLNPNALPAPVAETGPSSTLTDESAEHGADAVSHIVPGDAEAEAYVLVVAYKGAVEVASQAWHYDPAGDPDGPGGPGGPGDDFTNAQPGDLIGGGVYAGINTESDNSQYHIVFALQEGELAPSAESRWKTSRTTTPGTTSTTDGWANTMAMEAAGLADHPAALHCRNYTGGGHNDWYLPALTELALEANLRAHPELDLDRTVYRWSSTEYSSSLAWLRGFSDGIENGDYKDVTFRRVRPVRRVAV